jgi:acyl carrier protein phosphodiesterase
MNYLAHLFLASETLEARIGGILGDFEKGNIKGKYPKEIEIEIEIHRKIDYFTDSHLIVKEAKKVAPEEKRRYMGILLDVFYDHLLAQNWKQYSSLLLQSFTQETYTILLKNKAILPDNLTNILTPMVEEDWLNSYKEFVGFEKAIERISYRLKRGNVLTESISEIRNNYNLLSSGFEVFFPELIDYVKKERFVLLNSCN